jgi:hypothetical protein
VAVEPTINPYAPPASDLTSPPSTTGEGAFPGPLFSPRQMLAAAALGSVIAGVVLLQANYRAMGRAAAATKTLVFGLLASAGLFSVLFMLPARIPGSPITLATALTFYKLADAMQGPAFFKHRAAGGMVRSNWLVLGIIIASAVAVLILAGVFLLTTGHLDDATAPA